ncbi:angiopoietin-2-like isoform X2 [Contarinia nasturtii]|nr:angiopoietin-2-like isoform X2 [Contarinia nasturtii]XP_031621104.1 angiopoietin-2-like isoform X2 [Contarinia nasturtii]
MVVSMNDGQKPGVHIHFQEIMGNNNEKMLYNVPPNEVSSPFVFSSQSQFSSSSLPFSSTLPSSVTVRPSTLSEITKEPINDDMKQKMTDLTSPDNGYQSMKRAVDTLEMTLGSFNEKMERYTNIYGSEMTFLTTKLNNLKDKLNTLEILNHDIDQIMNHQNAAEQKLQVIQEAIFGSQSINGKLDRLEVSVQQLHARIDELVLEQRKCTTQTNRNKKPDKDTPSENDEQFRNVESKIEQLVGFVHSFAELNRLESSDILNRLGNMQSQLIQFFDANYFNQRNTNDTIKQDSKDDNIQFSKRVNSTTISKDANELNSSDVITESQLKTTPEMPSTLLHLNDDRKLSTSNGKFIRKRKRMTNMRNRSKRNQGIIENAFHLKTSNHSADVIQHGNRQDRIYNSMPNLDNHQTDVELDYSAIKSGTQVSAKYGQPTRNGCHALTNLESGDEIHRFKIANGFSERLCSFDKIGLAWTVIQSRGHFNGISMPENFNRSWNDYKIGFGNLSGDFWYGNDLLHKLTYDDDMELKIVLGTWDNRSTEFRYEIFRVDSEDNRYNLFVSGFNGSDKSLDAMAYHHNQDFSTFDQQNDKTGIDGRQKCCSCSQSYASGWWFNNCIEANLNGVYRFNPLNNNYVGIIWEKWLGDYSLKSTKMMIRPKVVWSPSTSHDNSNMKPQDDP